MFGLPLVDILLLLRSDMNRAAKPTEAIADTEAHKSDRNRALAKMPTKPRSPYIAKLLSPGQMLCESVKRWDFLNLGYGSSCVKLLSVHQILKALAGKHL